MTTRRINSPRILACAALALLAACEADPWAAPTGPGGGTDPGGGLAGSGGTPSAGVGGAQASAGWAGAGGSIAATGGSPSGAGQAGQTASDGGSAGAAGGLSGFSGFRHPGVLVSGPQLEFIRQKIEAGDAPWTEALERVSRSGSASLNASPRPRAVVECGPYSNPNNGCSEERGDAVAAYTHALIWALTQNVEHAEKAVEFLNAWADTLTEHTNHNAPLQAGWSGTMFGRAAEIIFYTSDVWAADDVEKTRQMFRQVFLPELLKGSNANGNWELTMIDAAIGMAVFLEDQGAFERSLVLWRGRTPAYFYLSSDGPTAKSPPWDERTGQRLFDYWYGQSMLVDGVGQETCRDLGHMQLGVAGVINVAETAWIQGVDLYAEESARIVAGLEFHAALLNGDAVPDWLCGGSLNDVQNIGIWEIAYNHYANRMQFSLPATEELVLDSRPTGGGSQHYAWESLTHAEVGDVRLP